LLLMTYMENNFHLRNNKQIAQLKCNCNEKLVKRIDLVVGTNALHKSV